MACKWWKYLLSHYLWGHIIWPPNQWKILYYSALSGHSFYKTSKSLDVSDTDSDIRSQDQWTFKVFSGGYIWEYTCHNNRWTTEPNQSLIIPLLFKGVTIYFPSRKPIASDYKDELITHIGVMIEALVWEPSETSFADQEDSMTDFRGEVIINEIITRGRRIIN